MPSTTPFSRAPYSRAAFLAIAAIAGANDTTKAQVIGFGGSSNVGWTQNSNIGGFPNVTGSGTAADVLTMTKTATNVTTSYWFNIPQNITNFTETFTYTNASGNSNNPADGIAVVWQNAGLNAIGAGGAGLGFVNITPSAALAMNIFASNSGSASQFNNTVTAGAVALTPTAGGVNMATGEPINVSLSYREADGALTETMTNPLTGHTFTRAWRGISIQGQVGGTTAIIGFTGATGVFDAVQTIKNFQFTPGAAAVTPVATITPIATTGYNQNMIVSVTGGSANVTATMDQGAGGSLNTYYEKGVNSGSTAAGVPRAGVIFGSGTDANHTFSLQPNGPGQNDALMLDSGHANGSLSFTDPAQYFQLSFLVSGALGGGNVNATIHYANGGSQSATISVPDWANNGPIALDANGRASLIAPMGTFTFNNTTDGNPRMYQEDLVTNANQAIASIDFSWGGSNREAIWGISGQLVPVPEPSSFALLGAAAIGIVRVRRRSASTP